MLCPQSGVHRNDLSIGSLRRASIDASLMLELPCHPALVFTLGPLAPTRLARVTRGRSSHPSTVSGLEALNARRAMPVHDVEEATPAFTGTEQFGRSDVWIRLGPQQRAMNGSA